MSFFRTNKTNSAMMVMFMMMPQSPEGSRL